MENDYVKYLFMPRFFSINNGFKETFVFTHPILLEWNIMREVTNDLGYYDLKESKENDKDISIEELQSHLGDMDKIVAEVQARTYGLGMNYLIDLVDAYHKSYYDLSQRINKIYELTTKNFSAGKALGEKYGLSLKEIDAEIDKGKIKEKNKEPIITEKREKKKGLLNRIFG